MKLLLVIALVAVFPFVALAIDYQGNCSVAFQGTSTLHNFEGTGRCQPFTVAEHDGTMTVPMLSVAVASMDTDNSKRDKKMREMFESEKYPLIVGMTDPVILNDVRNALAAGVDNTAEVNIQLKIRDIEKNVTAALQNVVEADSGITADLNFSLSLTEFKLEPPSVLGIIKVGDMVNVKTSFSLVAQ